MQNRKTAAKAYGRRVKALGFSVCSGGKGEHEEKQGLWVLCVLVRWREFCEDCVKIFENGESLMLPPILIYSIYSLVIKPQVTIKVICEYLIIFSFFHFFNIKS